MDGVFPRLLSTEHFISSSSVIGTSRIISPFPALESAEPPAEELAEEPLQLHFTEEAVAVEGQATGSYLLIREPRTQRLTYELQGVIQLYGLGRLELHGEISVMGGVRPRAFGELCLSTDVGTIALVLTASGDIHFDSLPETMQFSVTRATGPYSHAGGSGMVYLSCSPIETGSIHLAIV